MGRKYTSRKRTTTIEPIEVDGVAFKVEGGVSLLDLSELAAMADLEAASPEATAALHHFFQGALGKTEYTRFREHCRQHSTDPETLLAIMEGLVEDLTTTSFTKPSPSPDGSTATSRTSKVVSLSTGNVVEMPLTTEREEQLREAVARAAG